MLARVTAKRRVEVIEGGGRRAKIYRVSVGKTGTHCGSTNNPVVEHLRGAVRTIDELAELVGLSRTNVVKHLKRAVAVGEAVEVQAARGRRPAKYAACLKTPRLAV